MWDLNKLVLSHILDLFSIERVGTILSTLLLTMSTLNGIKDCEFFISYFDKYNLKSNKLYKMKTTA